MSRRSFESRNSLSRVSASQVTDVFPFPVHTFVVLHENGPKTFEQDKPPAFFSCSCYSGDVGNVMTAYPRSETSRQPVTRRECILFSLTPFVVLRYKGKRTAAHRKIAQVQIDEHYVLRYLLAVGAGIQSGSLCNVCEDKTDLHALLRVSHLWYGSTAADLKRNAGDPHPYA